MTTESLNDCRRNFEAWAEAATMNINYSKSANIYTSSSTQFAYLGWKAAWELQDARVKGCMT